MKQYLKNHEWQIIEEGFDPHLNRVSESIFSLGNGQMGQRANFEESYSGDMHQGTYVAGVYYPDKTRVGWWKNGYPEYFAKVLNAPSWIGIKINIEGQELDLAKCKVENFLSRARHEGRIIDSIIHHHISRWQKSGSKCAALLQHGGWRSRSDQIFD